MKGGFVAVLLGAFATGLAVAEAQEPQAGAAGQVTPPAPGALTREPQLSDDAALPFQAMRVGDLESRDIYTPRGERLGSVRNVVLDVTDGHTFLVLEHGGVAGLGEKEFPLPAERVFIQGGRLVVPSLTDAELEAVADWDIKDQKYREMADSEIINVARR